LDGVGDARPLNRRRFAAHAVRALIAHLCPPESRARHAATTVRAYPLGL
jgi:hypothetical protein